LHLNFGITEEWLSAIDSTFMLFSTLGNIITSPLVDRHQLNYILGLSISLSSVLYLLTSVIGYFQVTAPWVYLLMIALQGLVQSPIYPACVSSLGHLFPKQVIGKAMSLLSTSISFGNFLGAFITGLLILINFTWMDSMVLYSSLELGIGYLLYHQISKQYSPVNQKVNSSEESLLHTNQIKKKEPLPLKDILKVPFLKSVILSKMCIKFSYYSLSMWMPYYLSIILQDHAWIGIISGSIEIGGIIGAIFCGFLSDSLNTRPPLLQIYLIISFPLISLIGLKVFTTPWPLLFLFFFAGFCIGGCNLILITAVPIDLSQHPSVANYEVIGSITGILDASGSLGASIGIFFIGYLISISWFYVFLLLSTAILSALLILTPYTHYELKLKHNISIYG